ncbi:MAG: NAD-dependent epimerase/dehydratase family protein [Gemmatimonadales bacterium]|jgi:nucleoside-diphosphate-sugar epimerase
MRYFVTGGTGFIGRRLVRRLLADGHEVRALVRDPARAADLERLGARLCPGDITAPETLPEPMRGADGVYHVAGWYEVGARDTSPGYRINVEGTRNVLETMRTLGIPKGVYTSTLAVFSDTGGRVPDETYRHDGKHLSEYDRTKWIAHYEGAEPLMARGLPLVVVQPGVVYGPGDHSRIGDTLRDYLRRRLPVLVKETAFCWAHVDDTVEGHVLAMERGRPGETYIIGGEVHTLVEAIDVAARITGVPAPKLRLPPWILRVGSILVRPLAPVLPPTYSPETLRVSAGTTYLGDDTKARRQLGFDPRPLEVGLRGTLEAEMRALDSGP